MEKQWKCDFCKKTMTIQKKQNISNHYKQCKVYKETKDRILTKEFLYNEYVVLGKSAKQISEEIGIGVNPIIGYLKKHGIKNRSVKESHTMQNYKERIESTNLKKYGSTNPLGKGTTPYQQKLETVKKKYGVDNVRKSPNVIDKIKQSVNKWREENGHSATGMKHTPETKRKMRESTIKHINKRSGQIQPAYNLNSIPIIEAKAKELGITDLQHAENGGEFQVLGYFVDGYSKEKNIVIEYDEKHHFNIDGNLCSRDIQRQKEIEEHLGCTFIRIKDEN